MSGTEASARLKAPEAVVPAAPFSVPAPASAQTPGSGQAPTADLDALDRAAEGIRPSWHGASSSHPPAPRLVEAQAAVIATLPAPPSALASPWVTAPTTVGYSFEPAPAAPSPDATHPMGMAALHADDLDLALVPTTLGQFSNHPTVQRVRNWVLVRPRAVLAGGAALCVLLLIALWPAADNAPPPLPAGPKLASTPAPDTAQNALAAEPTPPIEPAAGAVNQAPAEAAEAVQPPVSAAKDAGASKEAALRNARNKRREAVRNNALKAAASSPRPEPRAAIKKAPESAKASKARQLLAPNPYR